MDPARRRDSRQVGQQASRTRHTLPFSCVEVPDAILPPPSAASGFIIADSSCTEVTPGGPACECRYTAEEPAAPLRVLLLPPAFLLPHDSSPDKPLDLVRRLLPQRDTRKSAERGGIASAEARETLRTSVLRLARQARLALDQLAVGYRIAGVWLRIDPGGNKLEETVFRQPDEYNFIKSLTNAISKVNASSPHASLNPNEAAELSCSFLFFSSRTTATAAADGGKGAHNILGYYCSGSSIAALRFHRLPVVIRQAEDLQTAGPSTRNIVYNTCIPVQVELRFIPSETFMLAIQASRQQLCAALASELYINFLALLSPPLLASAGLSKRSAATQSTPLAKQRYDASSFKTGKKVCSACANQKGYAQCTCTTPKKVTEELLCSPATASISLKHSADVPLCTSRQQNYQVRVDSYVNTREPPAFCSSVVLSSLSKSLWDECAEKIFAQASSSCLPLCSLQPLLVGDLVSRYTIFLDIPSELTDGGAQQGIQFRICPCDASCLTTPNNLSDLGKPDILLTGLFHSCFPLILSLKNQFVAAVVAPQNASLGYLRKSLAADAAAAIARRAVDCLADACAAYYHQNTKQQKRKTRQNPGKEQHRLSQNLASLEVRRFYTVCLDRVQPRGKKEYDGVVTLLLLSDFSNPSETEEVAAQAAVERFEVILGIPPSAVVTCTLRDEYASVAVCVKSTRSKALVDHEREQQQQQQQSESATNVTEKKYVLTTLGTHISPTAAFWDTLESRARKERITRLGACGGKPSAYGQKYPSRTLLYGCLALLAAVLAARLLFPSTT